MIDGSKSDDYYTVDFSFENIILIELQSPIAKMANYC